MRRAPASPAASSTRSALPALRGRYVFADFASGRLWAISRRRVWFPSTLVAEATALGRFSILPSTFAQGPSGELASPTTRAHAAGFND